MRIAGLSGLQKVKVHTDVAHGITTGMISQRIVCMISKHTRSNTLEMIIHASLIRSELIPFYLHFFI